MCDPRQLFLQGGPETPKVCTPQQRDCLPPCLALHLTVECILHPDRVWEPLATGTWASSQQSLSLLVDQVPHSSLWDKELAGDVHCYDMAGVAWWLQLLTWSQKDMGVSLSTTTRWLSNVSQRLEGGLRTVQAHLVLFCFVLLHFTDTVFFTKEGKSVCQQTHSPLALLWNSLYYSSLVPNWQYCQGTAVVRTWHWRPVTPEQARLSGVPGSSSRTGMWTNNHMNDQNVREMWPTSEEI